MLEAIKARSFNYESKPFKTANSKIKIDLEGVLHCLEKLGVRVIKNECEATGYVFLDSKLINCLDVDDVKLKFKEFIKQFFPKDYEYFLANGKRIDSGLLLNLPVISPKLHKDNKDEVFFYYENGFLKITKDSTELKDYSQLETFIYTTSVLQRKYMKSDSNGEFSELVSLLCGNDDKRIKALKSGLGYMLSRHKSLSVVKALVLNDLSLEEESGGTGKGILIYALGHIRKIQNLDFRNRECNRFVFQGVKQEFDIIHIEDSKKSFDFGCIFNALSGDFEVEDKGKNRISIPYSESPKIAISTNFYLSGNSTSHRRRKAEYELDNYFTETYRPIDVFGHELFREWDEVEWSKFDNYMIECVQIFLTEGIIESERVNLLQKSLILELNEVFVDFMEEWTNLNPDFSDKRFTNTDFFNSYRKISSDSITKDTTLKLKLKKWVALKGYKFKDDRTSQDRGFFITIPKG